MGTHINLSTTFHPQTNGQLERTIWVLEDTLWACVLEFGGQWGQLLPLVEFVYNNNYHFIIQMALFEALYGRCCLSPIGWLDTTKPKPCGTNLIHEAFQQVRRIQDRL